METQWNDGHRFSGRVALVTGAGGTLGGAVARGFGREGASVLVGYRHSRTEAESVVADIVASGGAASTHQLDVTDQASVDRFVDRQTHGTGGSSAGEHGRAPRRGGHRSLRAHERGRGHGAARGGRDRRDADVPRRHPSMRRHGHGAIINFSSTYGNGVNPENAINWVPVTYCAAKGAIRGLTTSLARDLAPEIRVNALAPGPISGTGSRSGASPPSTSKRRRR